METSHSPITSPTGAPARPGLASNSVDASTCPLCRQANQCALTDAKAKAQGRSTSSPCWCTNGNFSKALLSALPEHLRNKSCICATCAAESQPQGPVCERATWQGSDLAKDPSWQHELSQTELEELDAATARAKEKGLTETNFGREEFVLPTLGPRIEAIVNDVENGRGVALIRGLPVEKYDQASLRVLYWGMGSYFGELISQNSKEQRLAEVSNRGNDPGNLNSRGFSTNAELKPHVDTSDMTTLLCVRAGKSGGHSRVVSVNHSYNILREEHPEYLEVLFRGFYNDLRGEGPTGDINELTHNRVPVLSYYAGRLSCSLNMRMIDNGEIKSGVPFSELERNAVNHLRAITLRPENGYRFMMQPGDIQMVSNHSAFHSREAFEDHADPERRRALLRLWVNIRNGRPLAPRFADRYNTGPRGGVAKGSGAQYKI